MTAALNKFYSLALATALLLPVAFATLNRAALIVA